MKKILFPGAFYIGSDILNDFVSIARNYGKHFVFIGGRTALSVSKDAVEASFSGTDCRYSFVVCGKICSEAETARVEALPEVADAEVICALGGGSCMDIAKLIAFRRGLPLIMIPTTASSDSPCTFASIIYSEDGSRIISDYAHYRCPDVVMVDSKVIANAPERLIAAGMGDAMTTWYEGFACYNNPELKPAITETALMLANLCRSIVMKDGLAAYEAVKENKVTPELEKVIEANCFLSSIGGLNTGCACAHGFGDWLCTIPGGHDFMHGERVFIGLITQLILEKYPDEEIEQIMKFGRAIGLPICVGDMGVSDVDALAETAGIELENDHFLVHLTCDHSPEALKSAILKQQTLADNLTTEKE